MQNTVMCGGGMVAGGKSKIEDLDKEKRKENFHQNTVKSFKIATIWRRGENKLITKVGLGGLSKCTIYIPPEGMIIIVLFPPIFTKKLLFQEHFVLKCRENPRRTELSFANMNLQSREIIG